MKVAYVVPRYGDEVVGGAELAVRLLAERLVAHHDVTVEVLTTRAVRLRNRGEAGREEAALRTFGRACNHLIIVSPYPANYMARRRWKYSATCNNARE